MLRITQIQMLITLVNTLLVLCLGVFVLDLVERVTRAELRAEEAKRSSVRVENRLKLED